MPFINILDEATINQIAAGEVVERPSAVVKELIENAMDSGATAITAEIKEGGLSFIRITDNGSGIAKEDIPLAFLRHATSKIRSAEDLLSVTSLGFRGEALSSIAAVAQVELITKTPSALNGYRYLIEGGEERSFEEIGCPGGTTIIVRNLFFNTPARRKFLKSAMTEAGYISGLMEKLMISHPEISFKFIMNNQVKLQSTGNHVRKDILYQVYGRDITKELLTVDFQSELIKITGYIGKPVINRGNRNYENYFINGRYIKSNIITKAIEEAYKPYLMQHKYPFTSLYFEIDPSLVDVNVHPQKLEIRFHNNEELYRQTYEAIKDTLAGKEMIPKVSFENRNQSKEEPLKMPEPFEENRRKQFENSILKESSLNYLNKDTTHIGPGSQSPDVIKVLPSSHETEKSLSTREIDKPFTGMDIFTNSSVNTDQRQVNTIENASGNTLLHKIPAEQKLADNDIQANNENNSNTHNLTRHASNIPNSTLHNRNTQLNLFAENTEDNAPFLSDKALKEHRIIGQVFSTYWLVEYQKELYIIDQHAAHEKVLYERIMTAAGAKTYQSQQLLPPIVLSLTLREQEVIKKHEDVLSSLGYEIEHFGGNEYSVRAVPADLYEISEKDLLLEFIDELADESSSNYSATSSILERVASLSCKAAVKANHSFSTEEAAALIKELLNLDNPYHCPHGRPVIISMSQYELERKFKRIV